MVGIFFLITNFFVCKYSKIKGAIVVVFVWLLDLQLPMKSEPITTIVVSLNPAQARCTRYNILWWSFPTTFDRSVVFQSTLVSSTNKTDCHDISEILLKVALNTIPYRYLKLSFHQIPRMCVLNEWKEWMVFQDEAEFYMFTGSHLLLS